MTVSFEREKFISLLVYMADYQMIWLIAIFIASNRIFTEGICKLCDLIISDLIDEDFIENDREVSLGYPWLSWPHRV